MKTRYILLTAALLLAPHVLAQIPEGWEIVEIFPAGTEFYCGPPDINDRGQVVFHRSLWPPDLPKNEIFIYDRGHLMQVTDDGVYDAFPRINNNGAIVWMRDTAGRNASSDIVLWRDGHLTQVSFPGNNQTDGAPDVNDKGWIVWSRAMDLPQDWDEIYLWDQAKTRQITDNGLSNQGPRINRRGDLVLTMRDYSVSPLVSEILAYFGGALVRLSNGQRHVVAGGINDISQVVWDSPYDGLQLWHRGWTKDLVPAYALAGGINNRGDVAVTRFDVRQRNYTLWAIRQGELVQLTDGAQGGGAGGINYRGEIATVIGRFPSIGVAIFTKRAFAADCDLDGDVDLADFSVIQRCFDSTPAGLAEACTSSDINNDVVVDQLDVATFIGFLGGPE